jgi:hypothetical protein
MKRALVCISLLLIFACGSEAPTPPNGSCPTEGRYLPLVEGMSWAYQVNDPVAGTTEQKTSTVGALEDVGGSKAGVMAFRVTTTKTGGSTVSWQEDTGTSIRRHKELDMSGLTRTEDYYNPYKLRLDESSAHLEPGASWTESYTETVTDTATGATTTTDKTENWSVVAVDEVVTVPAGTFCTLRVQRVSSTSTGGGSDKTYWFARGVGKVRESGGSTEQLVSYTSP